MNETSTQNIDNVINKLLRNHEMRQKYHLALDRAITLCEMIPDLEFTSAIKQCGSDVGIPEGIPFKHFYNWAWDQVS